MYEVLTAGEYARRLEEVWMEGYWAACDDMDECEDRPPTPTPNPYEVEE